METSFPHDDLEQRLKVMKQEIDALQISTSKAPKPWYLNVSTLLSIIALLFSFGTTYVSYRRTVSQDIQSARQELRGLLQRLTALPKENLEAVKKYADDAGSRTLVGGFINQENSLLAKNAAEIAKKLPKGAVSATEFYAIAVALQNSYDLSGAKEFLDYSIAANPDFNTEISALRMIAGMRFTQARLEDGRVEYQRALAIFSKYPDFDPFTKISTNVQTELAWAYSEAVSNAFALANQHIRNAGDIVTPLPPSPGSDMLKAMVSQARAQLSSGSQLPNTLPPPPLNTLAPVTPKQ